MWTVLHPHSADDFLLSASYCSSFFAFSFGNRRRKVGIQICLQPKRKLSLYRCPSEESNMKYLKVLGECTLRWSDRFQQLTEKGMYEHAQYCLTSVTNSQSESATFLRRYRQKPLNIYSDPKWSGSAGAFNLTLLNTALPKQVQHHEDLQWVWYLSM